MSVVIFLVAAVILGGIVVVAMGRGGELARDKVDMPTAVDLRTWSDVARYRPPPALLGYHAATTEQALMMIARSIAERDAEIAWLRGKLAEFQPESAPGGTPIRDGAGPAEEPVRGDELGWADEPVWQDEPVRDEDRAAEDEPALADERGPEIESVQVNEPGPEIESAQLNEPAPLDEPGPADARPVGHPCAVGQPCVGDVRPAGAGQFLAARQSGCRRAGWVLAASRPGGPQR